MDHIIVLRKLAHALSHLLAVAVATQAHQRIKPATRGIPQRWPDLFWLTGQIVSEKVVLFHGERINPIMLLKILVVA